MRTCPICSTPIPTSPGRGRRSTYCTAACRKKAYRRRQLPREMTGRRAWVRADGKRPVTVDGRPASSTRRATWDTYKAVTAAGVAGDGLGIMLGLGLGCYDLDHCLDANEIAPWALEALAQISEPIVWVERSMSGDGLHVFVKAPEAPGTRSDGIERYTRERFIVVTRDRFVLPDLTAGQPAPIDEEAVAQKAEEVQFGARGGLLLEALTEGTPSKARVALAQEAARIADRLDDLDQIIAGKGVVELMMFRLRHDFSDDDERKVTVEIIFNSVLSEARQQATALKQILSTLGLGQTVAAAPAGAPAQPEQGRTAVDEVAARRAARRAGAADRART